LAVVYIDGEGKSGQFYASRYAEENQVSTRCIFPSDGLEKRVKDYEAKEGRTVQGVVIIDDFAGTGQQLSENLSSFARGNKWLFDRNIGIVLVVLASTGEAFERIQDYIGEEFAGRVGFRVCEILDEKRAAFAVDSPLWENESERNKAKSVCLNIGVGIYRDNPLGYGGQGLLVVFPNTVPNNTLPLLHSAASGSRKWRPLFPRLVN
jgi:hypothetical protein